MAHTAKTQCRKENSKEIFTGKELRSYSPNSYIHVSVCDLYISRIGLPILLQCRKIGGLNVEYIDRSKEILTKAAQFLFWEYINPNFFAQLRIKGNT